MAQGNDVLKRINERYPHLSKGQKLLANYITEHYEKAVYLTASKLGQIVGVSESTVVRFANELGYDGYPSLQRALEELVKVRLTALQRMEVSKGRMDQSHILTSILQADMDNIKATLEMADEEEFKNAVDAILRSRRIYILGVRSCASLAAFLGFYMNLLFDDVRLIHTNSVSETFEQMLKIGAEDVVIGISFPRYSKRTVRAMEFAKSRGAKVVAVTDSDVSPLIPFSDYTLKARSDMVSFVDSLVAPLSLLNSLIVALSIGRRDEITHSLSSLESIWKEYDVYDSEERDDLVFGKPLP